jgi:hypothetical protein
VPSSGENILLLKRLKIISEYILLCKFIFQQSIRLDLWPACISDKINCCAVPKIFKIVGRIAGRDFDLKPKYVEKRL